MFPRLLWRRASPISMGGTRKEFLMDISWLYATAAVITAIAALVRAWREKQ